jgi:hypothetical protein
MEQNQNSEQQHIDHHLRKITSISAWTSMYRPYPAAMVILLLCTTSIRAFANHCSSQLAFAFSMSHDPMATDHGSKDIKKMSLICERPSSPGTFAGQKRHLSLQMISDANEDGPPATKRQRQEPPREHRPGLNSYLKVLLDESTMNRFHNLTLQVQDHLDKSSLGDIEKTKSSSSSSNSPSDNQDGTDLRPRLRIKPRPPTSLHMTFCFGGKALCELPAEALTEWHACVSARFEESGLVSKVSAPIGNPKDSASTFASESCLPASNTTTSLDEYWFRVVDIRTFPPRRNNLVVAVLDASPRWHELYADIRSLARGSPSHALQDVVRSGRDEWIPHVTLANIYGGGKAEHHQLNQLLKELSLLNLQSTAHATESTVVVKASGISMGGPIPAQAELHWNFDFIGFAM